VPFLDRFVADAPRDDGIVIASEAKQSRRQCGCWIASALMRLAMTAGAASHQFATAKFNVVVSCMFRFCSVRSRLHI
jgi:hypothetical protein